MTTKNIHRAIFSPCLKAILLLSLLFVFYDTDAQITYTKQDSLCVVRLLSEGKRQLSRNHNGSSLMLFYGHKLIGIPYVAHTLEVNKREKLVINMRQLDCTTFVETVLALARTTVQGSTHWMDFCNNLCVIRYENGKINGYPSRNHYFLWWVESNRRLGIVTTPIDDDFARDGEKNYRIYKSQIIDLDWMTTHSSSYSMLSGNAQFLKRIREHERRSSGKTMMYIPKEDLGLSQKAMHWVQDGDILAISTNKKGLDTTHIGIAEWGYDGKLHLLNASQIHKKVILEPLTLKQYMQRHSTQTGIWVIRPVL